MSLQQPAVLHLLRRPSTHALKPSSWSATSANARTHAGGKASAGKASASHHHHNPNATQQRDEFDELGRTLAALLRAGLLILEPSIDTAEVTNPTQRKGSVGRAVPDNNHNNNTHETESNAEKHVQYGISMRLVCRKRISHRFTDFRHLHASLETLFPQYELPQLPDTKFRLFQRRSLDPKHIESKRQLLNQYLRNVTRLKGVGTCPAIVSFLLPNNQHDPHSNSWTRRPSRGEASDQRDIAGGGQTQERARTRGSHARSLSSPLLNLEGVTTEKPTQRGNGHRRVSSTFVGSATSPPPPPPPSVAMTSNSNIFFVTAKDCPVIKDSRATQAQPHCQLASNAFAVALLENPQRVSFPFHQSMDELVDEVRKCAQRSRQASKDESRESGQAVLLRFDSLTTDVPVDGCAMDAHATLTGRVCVDGHTFALSVRVDSKSMTGTATVAARGPTPEDDGR
jgi:hypothetical protein